MSADPALDQAPLGHETASARSAVVEQLAWERRLQLAQEMVPVIGRLHREGVVVSVHGRSLVNRSPIEILKAHRFARQMDDVELDVEKSAELLDVLTSLPARPPSFDLGLVHGVDQLPSRNGDRPRLAEPQDVVLYGFGRIGRLVARLLIERASTAGGLRLRAVVVRQGGPDDLVKRASLLRRDSVHGAFAGTIVVDHDTQSILANGTRIRFIHSDAPASVDYAGFGIRDAIVVDSTGRWRDRDSLSQHLLAPGASRVLLTAPGRGDVPNIVHGLNHGALTGADRVVSAASCTTNAISGVLKTINDRFGVQHCHVETVHSFTNDQNLIDNFHPGPRRGRSAALNLVLTATGAADAVAKAVPELTGRLTGNSIRVPTPDVSIAVLNLTLDEPTNVAELNRHLRWMSLHSPLRRQIDYVESPEVVSTDFLGSRRAGVVDGLATICTGTHAVVYVWYDNESGYSSQVVRVLETMAALAEPAPRARALVGAERLGGDS